MYVVINTYVSTNSKYSNEEYGNWSKSNINDIQSISITKDKEYWDLIIEDKFDTTKPCYLVYAEYSNGDSFGEETGILEYLKLFDNLDEAHLFKEQLNLLELYANSGFKRYDYKPELLDDICIDYSFDREFKYFGEPFHLPWGGFFSNLEKLDIKELNFVDFKD